MFDGILLASYGGPENLSEIEPFLTRVLNGKRIPAARRAAIAEHYARRGGVSPGPAACRDFLEKLRATLAASDAAGTKIRVYWGNLYAPPFFDDALTAAEADGIRNLLIFPTSAFGSCQSCRRYEDAARAALVVE
ncbi:MAG: ferrochelatase, partial [Thermoguttaceae bacterium]|nr:ferrochelatase [Thermoguttaceae bacterium]